jgi:hypothetical protein
MALARHLRTCQKNFMPTRRPPGRLERETLVKPFENPETHPPRCDTCQYVMPSATSATGLRCGLKYFLSPVWVRKFQRMQHFPEIQADSACESWALHDPDDASPA